ncbi:hypothetical protein [Nocardia xishanensis]
MNQPLSEVERLPSWKLGLLERIQNTAAEHARVLVNGHPVYQSHYGSGDVQIQSWRTHLRALAADRAEIEIHAAAVGVPDAAIAQVRSAGLRGQRWEDSVASSRAMRDGDNPVRAQLVDGIAGDVWQLEHMAAIHVAHQLRGFDGRVPRDAEADSQFDRNMTALWSRAADAAIVAGLTGRERDQLWERDPAGWQHLAALTVCSYSDAELHERWRVYAWGGIEHEVRRSSDHLTFNDRSQGDLEAGPPAPHVLIYRATQALLTGPTQEGTDEQIDTAVGAALPHDPSVGWDSEAVTEPDVRAPEPGASTGLEPL